MYLWEVVPGVGAGGAGGGGEGGVDVFVWSSDTHCQNTHNSGMFRWEVVPEEGVGGRGGGVDLRVAQCTTPHPPAEVEGGFLK